MATPSPPRSSILWQNATRTVTLLDIPRSISLAQGTPSHPCTAQIYSSQAIQTPYPSTEPKTEKAKANVLRTKSYHSTDAEFPAILLHQAHGEIVRDWNRGWCLKRQLSPFAERQKRKLEAESCSEIEAESAGSTQNLTDNTPNPVLSYEVESEMSRPRFHDSLDLSTFVNPPGAHFCPNMRQITNRLVHNPCPHPLSIQHAQSSKHAEDVYMIPPCAGFMLSKIDQHTASAFSMAALTMHPDSSATAGPGKFDFVLLDPPWENRSVRRTAKYKTMRESEPMGVLQSMLGLHIAPNALVACWITNKTSARATALEAFEAWEVQLIEEWAWLKTTEHGESVTEINGLWRKPYEILLVGKMWNVRVDDVEESIQRRVIVAVPDFHSRKPNLKALIEPMLPPKYRALEVFARNLTAEWMAWGDDAVHYAWEGHWSKFGDGDQIQD